MLHWWFFFLGQLSFHLWTGLTPLTPTASAWTVQTGLCDPRPDESSFSSPGTSPVHNLCTTTRICQWESQHEQTPTKHPFCDILDSIKIINSKNPRHQKERQFTQLVVGLLYTLKTKRQPAKRGLSWKTEKVQTFCFIILLFVCFRQKNSRLLQKCTSCLWPDLGPTCSPKRMNVGNKTNHCQIQQVQKNTKQEGNTFSYLLCRHNTSDWSRTGTLLSTIWSNQSFRHDVLIHSQGSSTATGHQQTNSATNIFINKTEIVRWTGHYFSSLASVRKLPWFPSAVRIHFERFYPSNKKLK